MMKMTYRGYEYIKNRHFILFHAKTMFDMPLMTILDNQTMFLDYDQQTLQQTSLDMENRHSWTSRMDHLTTCLEMNLHPKPGSGGHLRTDTGI
jgi:hypothetical protein